MCQGGVEPAAAALYILPLGRVSGLPEVDLMAAYGGKILGKILGVLPGSLQCYEGGNRCGKEVCRVRSMSAARDVKRRSVISKEGVISSPRSHMRGFQTTCIHQGECGRKNKNVVCSSKIKSTPAESDPDGDTRDSEEINGPAIPYNDGLWAIMLMRPSTLDTLSSWTAKPMKTMKRRDPTREKAAKEVEGSEVETVESITVAKQQVPNPKRPDPVEPHKVNEAPISEKDKPDEHFVSTSSIEDGEPAASMLSKATLGVAEEGSFGINVDQEEQNHEEKQGITESVGDLELSVARATDKPQSISMSEKTPWNESPVDRVPIVVPVGKDDKPTKKPAFSVQSALKHMQAILSNAKGDKDVKSVKADEEMKPAFDFRRFRDVFVLYFVFISGLFAPFSKWGNSATTLASGKPTSIPNSSNDAPTPTAAASANNMSYTKKSDVNNSNSSGRNSRSTSQKSSQPSPLGGSGNSGIGGGGGGGSDGDDNRGNLPDEPADGFGAGDTPGIFIVVAAVALFGIAIQKWVTRKRGGRRERDPVVSRREMVAGALRGGGNSVVGNESIPQEHHHGSVMEAVNVSQGPSTTFCDPTMAYVADEPPTTEAQTEDAEEESVLIEAGSHTSRGIDMSELINQPDNRHIESTQDPPPSAETSDYSQEVSQLRKQLGCTEDQLVRSEKRRKDTQKDLALITATHSTETAELRGKLLGQEEQNSRMQKRFGEIDKERTSLVSTVKDAETALTIIQPKLTRAADDISRLGEVMKYQKEELSKLRQQLGDALHEHGVVHRKLQNKEWEMQEIGVVIGAIQRIEKDLNGANCIMGAEEKLERISSGLKTLRTLDKKSKQTRQLVMPIQGILIKLRESLSNTHITAEECTKVKSHLKQVGDDQQGVKAHAEELQIKIRDLLGEKELLQSNTHILRKSLEEKTLVLEEVKLRHESAETVVSRGEAERDRLVHELDEKKADLRAVHESLAAAEKSSREAQAQTELLGEEKKNLQTQLTGLKHRINQFEAEAQRLHSDAESLRGNLLQEQSNREGWELKAHDALNSHSQMQDEQRRQMDGLNEELTTAQKTISELQEACKETENTKGKLQETHEEEISHLKRQIQKLQEDISGGAPLISHPSGADELNRIMERAMKKGLKVEATASATPYTTYTQPPGPDARYVQAPGVDSQYMQPPGPSNAPPGPMVDNDSRVMAWMENAVADDRSSLPPSPSPAPFYMPLQNTDGDVDGSQGKMQALFTGTTEPAERPRNASTKRRGSWPQDMSAMISDHIYGAAQEVIDLTGVSEEITKEKEGLLKSLDDAKKKITDTCTKLDEKDATMSGLTEHFFQVYQIASSLATEKENVMMELGDARLEAENLKEQLIERDARITDLESGANGRMLAHRIEMDAQMEGYGDADYVMATPRSTVSLGARPRSALPRPPSRSSVMTPTPRGPVSDVMVANTAFGLDTLSPRSGSQIPRAPGSDTTNSRPTPRQSESLDGQPYLPGAPSSDVQPKDNTPVVLKAEYPRSRTSMKRMPPGAPRRR